MKKLQRYARTARPSDASASSSLRPAPLRPLFGVLAAIELFLLALAAISPIGGVSQTISPLARAWPWLLAPARLVFGDTLVDASVPPEHGWPALALFAVLLVGASCAAALVVPVCRRYQGANRRHLALALGGAILLGLTLVLLPSLPSDDVFSYILYGRISAVHGANPLISAPSGFPNDPFLSLVFWRGVRSVYGPAWLLLSAGITHFAEALGGSLAAYVMLFKLVGLLAHLANVALIWAILGVLAPRRRLLGTLLYAWNPLCLLEFCASAHNDAVMLTFALLGIYCLARAMVRGETPVRDDTPAPGPPGAPAPGAQMLRARAGYAYRAYWEAAALVAFAFSISIKYVLLALLPFYFALVLRRMLVRHERPARIARSIGWRLALVCGVLALTALPYWAGPETLGAIAFSPPAQQLDNSLPEALSWPLRSLAQALGASRSGAAALVDTGLKIVALLVFAIFWLLTLRRVRDLESMLAAWGWLLVAYVVVASVWFWPWYVTWPLALAALLPWGYLTIVALLLAGGALTLYAFLPLYAAGVYGLRAWLVFGPALLYMLSRSSRGRRLLSRVRRRPGGVSQAERPSPHGMAVQDTSVLRSGVASFNARWLASWSLVPRRVFTRRPSSDDRGG